jgi:hypothetical protein
MRRRINPFVQQLRRTALQGLAALGRLSPTEIQMYASNAGFTGQDLATAVAIALAESSGIPTAYNPETQARGGTPQGKGAYGLWQIYLRDHPEFEGSNLLDPQTNANAAFSVYQAAGFRPWSTYKYGQYRAFLPSVPAAPPFPGAPPLTIDASTGQVIDDSTPTPPVDQPAVVSSGITPGNVLGLTIAAAGVYILSEILSD